MTRLTENIEHRVSKLTKPSNHTQALQPIFEAISNSIFAIEDLMQTGKLRGGRINVAVARLNTPSKVEIEVVDNGYGLDKERFAAFCEIDTDFKKRRGGKGVGRLFWLDAFQKIDVESTFSVGRKSFKRKFKFVLSNNEQIADEEFEPASSSTRGTRVRFQGIRQLDYAENFPRRADTFIRYFSAHFISDFLLGRGPTIIVDIDGTTYRFPQEVNDLVVGPPFVKVTVDHADFGTLEISGFTCLPEASVGLEGFHQLHLLANGRTVESRKIDNLLGITDLFRDEKGGLAYHGCVEGEYLNNRVNEGRTAFSLPESRIKDLIRVCVEAVKTDSLAEQVASYAAERLEHYEEFIRRYPIYGFDDAETQLNRVPFHAKAPEDFAAGLVKYQIRREEDRHSAIQSVICTLEKAEDVPADLAEAVIEAANGIHASEQLALAQHVVRRKLVLDLLGKLIKRFRERDEEKDDYQLEKTLHSFICPMGVRGDDCREVMGRAHDLWIVDEWLAFTRAFSSDKRLDQILAKGGGSQRPDLLLWDLSYGMGVTDPAVDLEHVNVSEPIAKMMVVELKKPMRKAYQKPEDQIEQQVIKYLAQLKGNQLESFSRDRIRIAPDCIFYCFVVADIVGDLEQQLSNWETTANGQGRIRPLKNEYRGSIEVIQWGDLINDAWQRSQATLHAAGLSRPRSIQGSI